MDVTYIKLIKTLNPFDKYLDYPASFFFPQA